MTAQNISSSTAANKKIKRFEYKIIILLLQELKKIVIIIETVIVIV